MRRDPKRCDLKVYYEGSVLEVERLTPAAAEERCRQLERRYPDHAVDWHYSGFGRAVIKMLWRPRRSW